MSEHDATADCLHDGGLSPSQVPGAYCLKCGAIVNIPYRGDYPGIGEDRYETYLIDKRGLTGSIQRALNELGIPDDHYPAPVANAVAILRSLLDSLS